MGSETMYTIGYILLMLALFYFLLIKPQQKMQKSALICWTVFAWTIKWSP